MMNHNYFFISDHHFYHTNIIEYCNRPFKDVEEMNNTMIDRWNEEITKNDIVYHLGDFSYNLNFNILKKLLSKLNYKQFHLILGNHEWNISSSKKNLFNSTSQIKDIKINNMHITLCHYPMISWNK